MKNYLKTAPFSKVVLLLSIVLLHLSSCKKEPALSTVAKKLEVSQTNKFIPEKVDVFLLNNYINYQMKVEANFLLQKAGKNIVSLTPKMDRKEFDLMIKNYLANERNSILRRTSMEKISFSTAKGQLNSISVFRPELISAVDPIFNNPPFAGSGSFPGTTISSIMFSGTLSNSGIISLQGFSFGGTHGTIVEVGGLQQTVYNGVTTYKQFFSQTIFLANGVVYVQNFVVYGNIYGDTVTVNAMQLPQSQ